MTTYTFILMLGALLFGSPAAKQVQSPQVDYQYIGADKCKMCHNKTTTGAQYTQWAASKHANAMKVLTGDDAKNPKCLKCHSTYHAVTADEILSITEAEGVSCESCHGPGSVYKSLSIMQSREKSLANGLIIPTEETCKKCHNAESPTFKGFDYKTAVEKIKHPNPSKE